jgi:hypothetical protein
MSARKEISDRLFGLSGEQEFNDLAMEIFHYQVRHNKLYREFSGMMLSGKGTTEHFRQVPFLPIGFFREHKVISGSGPVQAIFTSSATTGSIPASHMVSDLGLYRQSFLKSFTLFYGDPMKYRFLVLLPGYLEREGSSLVYMMEELAGMTRRNGSGFFLHDFKALAEELKKNPGGDVRTVLFGASYALLDFAESRHCVPVDGLVMETGGMKGRKREMIREELHGILCRRFEVEAIHSEYGMTELMSQAYSHGRGIYRTPPWMKVLVRDMNDPLEFLSNGKTGGISIIDLANLDSCSFIATQDLGRAHEDGSFEILGRFDDSDIRGCNLMVV